MPTAKKKPSHPQPAPHWGPIKKHLNDFSREGLLALVKDLYDLSASNRSFLAARFAAPEDANIAIEGYRQRIIKIFFPERGFPEHLQLGEGRKAIREYRKATADTAGTLDLMLTYVEAGTRFTNEYGDMWEAFYDSLESMLAEAAKLLQQEENRSFYPQFQKRLLELRKKTADFGWGYGDAVEDIVGTLEDDFSEENLSQPE